MRSLLKMTVMEAKLFLREPVGAFFTLIFPVMMLFLFGGIYGNEPTPLFGGYGTVDVSVPAYTAMIIATSGLMSLTVAVASYREKGVLRRLRATPVSPLLILAAALIVIFAMTCLGMSVLIAAGALVYRMRFPGSAPSLFAGFLLGSLSFFSLGFVLGGLMPNARTAHIVSLVLLYPMLFLSGAGFPRELLPEGIRRFSVVLPLTHVVTLLRGLWMGESWGGHLTEVAVLAAILLVGAAVSARTFRWE